MNQLQKLTVATLFLSVLFLVGCSTDTLLVIEHPVEAKPGDTITVELGSFYGHATPMGMVISPVNRDSLHFLIGLPEGWRVLSVDYHIARDWKFANDLLKVVDLQDLETDNTFAQNSELFTDSIASFRLSKQPMESNPSLAALFAGRTHNASAAFGTEDEPRVVTTDGIDRWVGFSSPVNIRLAQFSPTDTVVSLPDSVIAELDEQYQQMAEAIGVTIVPVYLHATIITGDQAGLHDIYYYSKTAQLPEGEDFTQYPDLDDQSSLLQQLAMLDRGSMVYVSVNTGPDVSVLSQKTIRATSGDLKAYPASFSAHTTITVPENRSGDQRVVIKSLDGKLVKILSIKNGANQVIWDGTDRSGSRAVPGTYVVSFVDSNRALSSVVVNKIR